MSEISNVCSVRDRTHTFCFHAIKIDFPPRIGLNNLSFVSLMTFCFNLHNVINTNYGELEKLGKRYKTKKHGATKTMRFLRKP